jgi:hypothetical protein
MATTAKPEKTEKVKIKLPLTREKQDDVFVSVNGESYLIKRGQEVEVPVYIKEILDNKESMEALALERQKELQG